MKTMPETAKIRKRLLYSEPPPNAAIYLGEIARMTGSSQTVLRALYEAGRLPTLIKRHGFDLYSTKGQIERWLDKTPLRSHKIRQAPNTEMLHDYLGGFRETEVKWWFNALWRCSLLNGRAWEQAVPKSELMQDFSDAVGFRATFNEVMNFLDRVLPPSRQPEEIRFRPKTIVDGEIRRGDERWVRLAEVEVCRIYFNKIFQIEIPWHLATIDPVGERKRAEQIAIAQREIQRIQSERAKQEYDAIKHVPQIEEEHIDSVRVIAIMNELNSQEEAEKPS